MIVKSTCKRTLIIVALISLTSCNMMLAEEITSTESSSEYLRKVMLELRDFNLPPSTSTVTQRSSNAGSYILDVDDKHYLAGKRHSSGKRIIQESANDQNNLDFRETMVQQVAKKIRPIVLDQMMSETGTNENLYYQVPGAVLPSSQIAPEVSSFTKSELNAAYKDAMEKGSAASLNALANVLRHRQLPKVTTNQIEIGDQTQPLYTYYFYPLKTFMNDVRQGNNGLLPAINFIPENTGLVANSQKHMGNPLFMAISGFVGMAVLFMIGVLLLPRIGDFFDDFRSRVVNDEKFLDMTKTVGEAIDRHNCTDQQEPYVSLDERLRILCQPINKPKPSSVVLLTRKSALQKEAKRRRKISKKCKIPPCKKNIEQIGPT